MLVRHFNIKQLPCKGPYTPAESERVQHVPSSHVEILGGQQHLETDSVLHELFEDPVVH